jgi:ligand-binding sensor domain-containing protein/serine phosphatase RsbU (regulator of sigma subunit)
MGSKMHRASGSWTLLLLLGSWAGVASAQPATPAQPAASTTERPRYILTPAPVTPFDCVTDEDGLPNLEVSAITQDQKGYIWFGTPDGLARYDGYKMAVYRHGEENTAQSLSHPLVTALASDRQGRVFVGTEGGLDVYRAGRFERLDAKRAGPEAAKIKQVISLLVDGKGIVWIGTREGLYRYDPEAGRVASFPANQDPNGRLGGEILALHADSKGRIWVGTDRGLSSLDPASGAPREVSEISGSIAGIAEDSDGTLWLGSAEAGVSKFDPASGKVKEFRHVAEDPATISDDSTLSILRARSGQIWIGTNGGGLSRLDPTTGAATRFAAHPGRPLALPRSRILSIFEDRTGVLWFGTWGGGACKLDPYRLNFTLYHTMPGVGPIAEDAAGVLWMGSQNGLHRFDRKSGAVKSYIHDPANEAGIPGETVWSLKIDHTGAIWLGVMGFGLSRFDPKTETFTNFAFDPEDSDGVLSNVIFNIYEDSKKQLWLGTWGAGVALHDPKKGRFRYFNSESKAALSSDFIYVIREDRQQPGTLWIGTNAGLNRLDAATGAVSQYAVPPGGKGDVSFDVFSIHQDAAGTLWLGTSAHGLLKFDPRTGAFERQKSIPNAAIYGIMDDSNKKFWLTSTAGLFRFDPATGAAVKFDKTDGLQGLEFTQNAFYKSERTGELFVGGSAGLNIFKPEQIRLDPESLVPVITRFQILGKDIGAASGLRSGDELELSYFDRMLTIEFSALSFGAPSKQEYFYRLKGLHDDWIPAPTRTAAYSKLDGGDYVLEVKAVNRHGVSSQKTLSLDIHVSPPPWKTWWAYTAYGVVLLAIIALYLRAQRKRLFNVERDSRLKLAEKDLELMSAVQLWFLPKSDRLDDRRLRFKAFYRPAGAGSGDWWWYERLPDDSLWILVADVTGHGAGPAVVTASVATACRSQRIGPVSLAVSERIEQLNRQIAEVCGGKYLMSLTSVVIPAHQSSIDVYTAGGLPPMLINQDGSKVQALRGPPSTPLGSDELKLSATSWPFTAGDRLVLFTDGLVETESPVGAQYGIRRLRQDLVGDLRTLDVDTATQLLVGRLDTFRGPLPPTDDLTFVLLEFNR